MWRITSTTGTIKITFDDFNVQGGTNCPYDFLKVTGPIKRYGKITLCGTNMPGDFSLRSEGPYMTLKLKTDGSTRKWGFHATVKGTL